MLVKGATGEYTNFLNDVAIAADVGDRISIYVTEFGDDIINYLCPSHIEAAKKGCYFANKIL